MLTDIISVGNKIEIKSNAEKSKTYLSQIEDISDKKYIRISAPIHEGKIVPLTVGATYELVILVKESCYWCKAIITNRNKEDTLHYMELEIITDLKKFQRRNFFRFKCVLDMKYIVFEKFDQLNELNQSIANLQFNSIMEYCEKNGDFKINDGLIKDISGGGIRFVSNGVLQKGNGIKSAIILNNFVVNIDCEIVQVNHINNDLYKYEYQSKYINISDDNREKVIKYIFDAQRKLLQKSKGM